MRIDTAMALLSCADAEFLAAAGPAVLRLKLLEVMHLSQSPRVSQDMREAARLAAQELRQLILARPCVSLIDCAAQRELSESARAA